MAHLAAFVNCTDPQSTCEAQLHSFWGVNGVCDRDSGLCVCPEGYTGVDLMKVWNDCHISKNMRMTLELIALGVNYLAIFMAIYGIVRLLRSWEAKPILIHKFVPWFEFPKVEGEVSYQRLKMEKRKRFLFMLIFINLLVACSLGSLFQIISLANPSFAVLQRPNHAGLLFIALQIAAIIFGMYMVLYAWFDSLPSFRLFARMFPEIRTSFLVRHPNFIFFGVVINTMLTASFSFSIFFLFSIIRPELIADYIVPWGVTLFGIEIGIFMLFLAAVCVLLLRLVGMFSAESSERGSPGRPSMLSPEARKRFKEARHTILAMLTIAVSCAPIAMVLCMFMAWHPYARANFFFFIVLLQVAGALVSLFIIYVFVFRMHYATKKPGESAELSPVIDGGIITVDGSLSLEANMPNSKISFLGLERKPSS